MITNFELFRKLMHASKELRMRTFRTGCGEKGERPEPPMPPEMGKGMGCRRGEGMPPMPPHGMEPHGRGPGCHGGRRGHGMSRERLLLFVAAHPDKVWQKDVAGDEGINASSASEMISKLVEDGYLIREADEADKRAVVLKLTEKGQARADEIRVEREAVLAELFSRLTDDEKQTLSDLLDKLLG